MTIARLINEIGFKIKDGDVKKVNNTIADIKSTATKLLGAIGVGISLAAVNSLVEEFSLVSQQVKNSTAELGEQEEIQEKILAAATATRTAYAQTAGVVADLVHENAELFGTIDEAIAFNNAATMLFKTAGKTNAEIAGLMEAINKSFAKGYVDSETLSQMLEKAPEAVELLNKQLGTTSDQLEQMASDGKFSVQDLKAAFVNNANVIAAAYSGVKMTVTEAIIVIRNKWGLWLAETNEMIGLTDTVGKVIVKVSDTAMRVLTKLRTGVIWLAEKLGGVENLLKTLAIAAGAVLLAFNLQKIIAGIKNIGTAIQGITWQTWAFIAIVIVLALLIEDFINFMRGNNSLLGEMLERAGIDADAVRETIINAWTAVKGFLLQVWEVIKKVCTAVWGSIRTFFDKHGAAIKETLAGAWNLIKTILVTAWNVIKYRAQEIFDALQKFWNTWGETIKTYFAEAWRVIQDIFGAALDIMTAAFAVWSALISGDWQGLWDSIRNYISTVWNSIISVIGSYLEGVKNVLASAWSVIESNVVTVWQNIKNAITTPINRAWETVQAVVNKLKKAFDFKWSLPELKVPHITVSGGEAPYGIGGKGSLPSFDIEWYKKGGILDGATIFGTMGGKLLGGGEAGKEAVIPLAELWKQMRAMIVDGITTLTRNLSPLADLNTIVPATAGSMISNSNTRTIVITNNFSQQFNGERAAQQKANTAMKAATTDISGELARALAFVK